MTLLPGKGFWRRLRSHAILFSHPNYFGFKKYLRNIWSGK